MASYSKKIVKRICELISNDSFTIPEICEDVGIAESTYHKWKAEKIEFSEAIEASKQKFNENLIPEAKKSLRKLVTGYTVTETKTVTADTGKKNDDGNPIVKVKEHSKIEKHIQPNFNAIAFALTNQDPDNWKHKQSTELTGKNGESILPSVVILPSNDRDNENPED
jgi:hypothetical protein